MSWWKRMFGVRREVVAPAAEDPKPSQSGEALIRAVFDENVSRVRELIQSGVDVNYCRSDMSPLTAACACNNRGNLEIMRLLLDNGADPNLEPPNGDAPIFHAWYPENARLLLSFGASQEVYERHNAGHPPLVAAVNFRDAVGVMAVLLDHGADVNGRMKTRPRYGTPPPPPLHFAAYMMRVAVVELLCKRGADANLRAHTPHDLRRLDGLLPIHVAASASRSHGPDGPSSQDIKRDNEDRISILKLLLANGADVSAKTHDGRTALSICESMYQRCSFNSDTVEWLRQQQAPGQTVDLGLAGDRSRNYTFDDAICLARMDSSTVPWPDHKLGLQDLASHLASIQSGASDINGKHVNGWAALTAAARFGHTDTVKLLLSRGADVNAEGYLLGETALMSATTNGRTETVRLLLSSGADLKAINRRGDSALTLAVSCNHEDIVELLLSNGADVNAERNGKTLLMLTNKPKMKELLKAHGAME